MTSTQSAICFRVDGSHVIGIGHIMRCFTLADKLREEGFYVRFVCRLLPESIRQKLIEAGHEVVLLNTVVTTIVDDDNVLRLDQLQDAKETLSIIDDKYWHTIVIDHYGIDWIWEQAVRHLCDRIIVIDDLANRRHDCDLLVDQTLNRHPVDYRQWVAESTELLVGAEYAIMREAYQHHRASSLNRRQTQNIAPKQLLISLGGSDQTPVIKWILVALKQSVLSTDCRITLVTGGSDSKAIREFATSLLLPLTIIEQTDRMFELLSETDLVIGAAGTSAWERCCLGVPSIIVVLAPNQLNNAKALAAENAALLIESPDKLETDLPRLIDQIVSLPGKLTEISCAASQITTGLGLLTIVEHLKQSYVKSHTC